MVTGASPPRTDSEDGRDTGTILEPGRTCWRIERADRMAFIVDADAYFRAVKGAILNAHHSVLMIGWDFDTRIKLEPDQRTLPGPERLGRFLNWIVKKRPELHIHVLKWDLGVIQTFGRGSMPLMLLDMMTSKRIRFKLDGAHPPASAHHQKIIVVDDALAFCGGIDMTADRWDTREHPDDSACRVRPSGRVYGPWHDAATAVDGAAARALGELARERWLRATGDRLDVPPEGGAAWPELLPPTLEKVDIAIARTLPEMEDRKGVYEIEALYLAAIKAVRRTLYLESQYFASRRIAEAIAARLSEPDPPEIVVVNPQSADGWLEEQTMDSARKRLLKLVRKADRQDRFRIFYPATEKDQPIYVHAKVTAVDDRLLRVGSSNLNNRSLGFDTECDLALEAGEEAGENDTIRRTIRAIRDDLLGEHLGVSAEDFSKAVEAAGGSLIGAIESLRREKGRSLRVLVPKNFDLVEDVLAENDLLDPERPPKRWKKLKKRLGLA